MDDFASDESQSEDELFTSVIQQRNYFEKIQNECRHYDHIVAELEKELSERTATHKKLQVEMENLQRDILYNDLKIEKVQNVCEELKETNEDETHLDPQEKIEAVARLENEVTKNLKKYINRVFFSKKQEQEEKLEKIHHQYSAVCVKFYKDDPTSEDDGVLNAQNYSYQVFGLSSGLTFQNLFELAKKHFSIENLSEYVLTDPDHHDLTLLFPVSVSQFLAHETHGYALFIIRKRNTTMKELVSSQKAGISLIQETEKQTKITKQYREIFETLIKAKPGIARYEIPQEDETPVNNSEGSFLNFIGQVAVLVLIVLSLALSSISRSDRQMLNEFTISFAMPEYIDDLSTFYTGIPDLLTDLDNSTLEYMHYVPVGTKRIIMNKMKTTRRNTVLGQEDTFSDHFTSDNTDKTPLVNVTEGTWKYYTQAKGKNKIHVKGKSSTFDGSGFIYDVAVGLNSSEVLASLQLQLNFNNSGDYFSIYSRAYIFHFLYFEPNRLIFIDRTILCELTTVGTVDITERKAFFKRYSSDNNDARTRFGINIALLAATILVYLLNVIRQLIRTKKIKELYKPANVVKYINVGLVVAFFVLIYQQPDQSTEEIVSSTTSQNLQKYGENRALAVNLLSIALFIHCLTMIRSFVFSKNIQLFLDIFGETYKDFVAFFILFFATLIAFSYVWWIVFSPYDSYLGNLFATAFELFQFFGTGDTSVVNEMFLTSEFWTVMLVILTCLIIFIQLDSLMMSLIIENVRYLLLKRTNEQLPFKESLDKVYRRIKFMTSGMKERIKKSSTSRGKKT